MQISLTPLEKRGLERSLCESGFSLKQAKTAVSKFAAFLGGHDTEEDDSQHWKSYWRNFATGLFKKTKVEEK
ncbi:MAG: hypothetical protein ABFD97_10065 [Syntrophobacter sp.]